MVGWELIKSDETLLQVSNRIIHRHGSLHRLGSAKPAVFEKGRRFLSRDLSSGVRAVRFVRASGVCVNISRTYDGLGGSKWFDRVFECRVVLRRPSVMNRCRRYGMSDLSFPPTRRLMMSASGPRGGVTSFQYRFPQRSRVRVSW